MDSLETAARYSLISAAVVASVFPISRITGGVAEELDPRPGTTLVFRVSWRVYAILLATPVIAGALWYFSAIANHPAARIFRYSTFFFMIVFLWESRRLYGQRVEVGVDKFRYQTRKKASEVALANIREVTSTSGFVGIRLLDGSIVGLWLSYFRNGNSIARYLERCATRNTLKRPLT